MDPETSTIDRKRTTDPLVGKTIRKATSSLKTCSNGESNVSETTEAEVDESQNNISLLTTSSPSASTLLDTPHIPVGRFIAKERI